MVWSYDANALDRDTAQGRLYIVRYLIGDTDKNLPQLEDGEIEFLLRENADNPRSAAVSAAESLFSKYSRQVNREVGDLALEAGALASHYAALADRLRREGRRFSPATSVFIGNDPDQRLFRIGMHDTTGGE